MLVQPQQAATVCEFDLVRHTIGSLERAQTLDPNPRPESSHEPLNLTLDLEYAHVNGDLFRSDAPKPVAGWTWPCVGSARAIQSGYTAEDQPLMHPAG